MKKFKNKVCLSCQQIFQPRSSFQCRCDKCRVIRDATLKSIMNIYRAMKRRCYDVNAKDFRWYGDRNIKIGDEWKEYKNFKNWMLKNSFLKGLTVDRIDRDCNYEPSNCRLLTIQENLKNRVNIRTFWETRTARCKKCQKIKSFSEFHKSSSGVNTYCKECRNYERRKTI